MSAILISPSALFLDTSSFPSLFPSTATAAAAAAISAPTASPLQSFTFPSPPLSLVSRTQRLAACSGSIDKTITPCLRSP